MKGNTQYFSASEAKRYPTHSGSHSPLLALTAATAYPRGVLYLFCRSKSSIILIQSAAMVLCSYTACNEVVNSVLFSSSSGVYGFVVKSLHAVLTANLEMSGFACLLYPYQKPRTMVCSGSSVLGHFSLPFAILPLIWATGARDMKYLRVGILCRSLRG